MIRSKLVTDKDGNYVLNTVYPVRLQGPNEMTRPSHIHVIVGVPGQPLITTQVYFENQPKDSLLSQVKFTCDIFLAIESLSLTAQDYKFTTPPKADQLTDEF
jgi:protocatechuate 3,4-dioxygenase beta subunit